MRRNLSRKRPEKEWEIVDEKRFVRRGLIYLECSLRVAAVRMRQNVSMQWHGHCWPEKGVTAPAQILAGLRVKNRNTQTNSMSTTGSLPATSGSPSNDSIP